MRVVNLSSRPFVNERPVVRVSIALWVLGGLLLAVNIYSYAKSLSDSKEIRGEVAELRKKIDREEGELAELAARASAVDVYGLNVHAVFLNDLIRYRAFPWGRLFDDLEEVLPKEVRLTMVHPEVEPPEEVERILRRSPRRSRASSRRTSREEPPPEAVAPEAPEPPGAEDIPMLLKGFAKSDEVILDFVDLLFEHPRFRDPDFQRESLTEQTGQVSFDIRLIYILDRADDGSPGPVAENEESGSAGGDERAESSGHEALAGEAEGAAITRTTFSGDEPHPSQGAPRPEVADPSRARRGPSAGVATNFPPASTGSAGERSPFPPAESGAPPTDRTGSDLAGVMIGGVPVAAPPGGDARSAPAEGVQSSPPAPGRQRITPTRLRPPPASGSPRDEVPGEERDPRRPRFVEPDASGTTLIFPGGGS